MDQFSFDFGDPIFDIAGWRVGLQVITFENTYGLDPERAHLEQTDVGYRFAADRLMWAGNQEKAAGQATLTATPTDDGLELVAAARHSQKIRCTKIILRGLPNGALIGNCWRECSIDQGQWFNYPPQVSSPGVHTPLVFLRLENGDYLYFRSLDTQVQRKGFAIYHSPFDDGVTVELLHEDLGPQMTNVTQNPPWRIGRTRNPDAVVAAHLKHLEEHFGLTPWESNPLIPDWLRDIALVAYIHGQHWTGYIFNNYEEMRRILRNLAARFAGRRILAHLAGWEGRYYWDYGQFTPDPRMGGAEAFQRLCQEAHSLGVHLQLMLGCHCANTNLPGFEQWGATSFLRKAGGAIEWGNCPDWDTSRTRDTTWQAWLNPGAPGWHNRLLQMAADLVETYGVDSIFLDTHSVWQNDPNFPVYEGLVRLRDELKARYPDVLLTGECWYDVLGAVTPLSHADWMQLERWPELFTRYNRTYGHNGWGDPSRNSAGVFEGGYRPFQLVPDAQHWIPTLIIVDGTLEKAPGKVDLVLEQARRYAARYGHR